MKFRLTDPVDPQILRIAVPAFLGFLGFILFLIEEFCFSISSWIVIDRNDCFPSAVLSTPVIILFYFQKNYAYSAVPAAFRLLRFSISTLQCILYMVPIIGTIVIKSYLVFD